MKGFGQIVLLAVIALAGILALFVPFLQAQERPREVVLVARGMAFTYPSSEPQEELNPALTFRAGERIILVFRNQDQGMLHNLRIHRLGLETPLLKFGESARLTFTVPSEAGTDKYSCTLHSLMMTGRIVIK